MDEMYPKLVRPCDVVNGFFAPGLFMLEGGRAKYDQVYMHDGGGAVYLVRIESCDNGLKVVKRWIDWDAKFLQMFDPAGVCDG